MKNITITSVFLIALALLGCSKEQAASARISFLSNHDGKLAMYVADSNVDFLKHQVVFSANIMNANFTSPVLSPDGKKIAFQTNQDGNSEIYVIDLIDMTEINLTKNDAKDFSPAWSSNGNQIAFISDRDALLVDTDRDIWSNNIYVMDNDGQNVYRLTKDNQTASYNEMAWSMNGKQLLFNLWDVTPFGGYFPKGINSLNLSNNQLTEIVVEPYNAVCCARWSPNGTQIVYSALGEDFEYIHILNLEESISTAVTKDHKTYNKHPFWSPDGGKIIFSSNRDGDYDIYIIDIDGTNLKQITDMPGDETSPTWSVVK